MNETRVYNDELDGNYLACKLGDVAEGLELICSFSMPLVEISVLLNGLYSFSLVYMKRCHRKLLARYARNTAHFSNVQNSIKLDTETFSFAEKFLLSNGVGCCCVSRALVFLVYGHGTM